MRDRPLKYTSIFEDEQPIFRSTKNERLNKFINREAGGGPLKRPASINEVETVCNLLRPYLPDIALGIYIYTDT